MLSSCFRCVPAVFLSHRSVTKLKRFRLDFNAYHHHPFASHKQYTDLMLLKQLSVLFSPIPRMRRFVLVPTR